MDKDREINRVQREESSLYSPTKVPFVDEKADKKALKILKLRGWAWDQLSYYHGGSISYHGNGVTIHLRRG